MARVLRGHPECLDLKRKLRSEMTGAEARLWSRLRMKQFQELKFRRQHGIGPYIVDFYCPERALVVEVDGDSHADANQIKKDRQRESYLRSLGLQVVRYQNDDIIKNLDGVLEDLSKRVSLESTSPSPPYKGGGDKPASS